MHPRPRGDRARPRRRPRPLHVRRRGRRPARALPRWAVTASLNHWRGDRITPTLSLLENITLQNTLQGSGSAASQSPHHKTQKT